MGELEAENLRHGSADEPSTAKSRVKGNSYPSLSVEPKRWMKVVRIFESSGSNCGKTHINPHPTFYATRS